MKKKDVRQLSMFDMMVEPVSRRFDQLTYRQLIIEQIARDHATLRDTEISPSREFYIERIRSYTEYAKEL